MSHLEDTTIPAPTPEMEATPTPQTPNSGSGKTWWVLGGVGCLFLLLCCGGGGVLIGLPAMGIIQAQTSAFATITESQAAQDLLGTPIEVGEPTNAQQNGKNVTMVIPVSGPKGSGTATVTITPKGIMDFPVTSIILKTDDGEEVDLLNSDEFNIKIEDPGDFEGDEGGESPAP